MPNVLERMARQAAVAALSIESASAVDELLFTEAGSSPGAGLECEVSLERARRREGPARAAAALVLDLGDDAARAPVDARGQVGRFLLVVGTACLLYTSPSPRD